MGKGEMKETKKYFPKQLAGGNERNPDFSRINSVAAFSQATFDTLTSLKHPNMQ